jgi:hypothetical protein
MSRRREEQMLTNLRVVGAALVTLIASAALLLAPAAGANHLEPGMTVSVGDSARLVNGVYLEVPVTVVCPTLELTPTQWIQNESLVVRVTERVGKILASGSGQIFYDDGRPFGGQVSGTPFVCDGAPHTFSVNVFPEPTSPGGPIVPFKGGKAVSFGYFSIFVQDSSTFRGDPNNVRVGPSSISIKG